MSFVSPMGYPGGKYYMLKDVYSIILKADFDTIVDVFGGSGKVLLNMPMNTLFGSYKGIYNDIDKQNIEFFEVVRDYNRQLCDYIKHYKVTEKFIDECKKYGDLYDKSDKVFRAYMTWINYKYSWSGFASSSYRKSTDMVRDNSDYTTDQIEISSKIVKHWDIYNKDYRDLKFLDSDRTFWYFDPPYRGSDVYYYNFTDTQFYELSKFLKTLKGQYLLNIDEDNYVHYYYGEPNMRKTYRNLMMKHEHASDREEWFYWKIYNDVIT